MVILTDDHTGCLVGLWTPDPEEIVSFAIVFLRKNSQWEREFQFMEESVRSLLAQCRSVSQQRIGNRTKPKAVTNPDWCSSLFDAKPHHPRRDY
jgi:hypothetical protein